MFGKRRILGIDDDQFMLAFLGKYFNREGYEFVGIQNPVEAVRLIETQVRSHEVENRIHCVLTDLNMPQMNGLTVLEKIHALDPDIPVIVITAFGSVETAVTSLKKGAYDYVTKPFQLNELKRTLEKALEFQRLVALKPLSSIEGRIETAHGVDLSLLGESAPLLEVHKMIRKASDMTTSVLIVGENGVGKALIARSIHDIGKRSTATFVTVGCRDMSESALDRRIFGPNGDEAGSQNETSESNVSINEPAVLQANGGTLFIDDIDEMSPYLQQKLVHFLQEMKVRATNHGPEIAVDVRIIAAARNDLKSLVHRGAFREDLFYAISVLPITVPSLRERPEDIAFLAPKYLIRLKSQGGLALRGFSERALQTLQEYEWPGNIRQLENTVQRAATKCDDEWLSEAHIAAAIESVRTPEMENSRASLETKAKSNARPLTPVVPGTMDTSQIPSLRDLERQHMIYVLEKVGWKKERAAEILGISRKTLYRKEIEYGLRAKPHGEDATN